MFNADLDFGCFGLPLPGFALRFKGDAKQDTSTSTSVVTTTNNTAINNIGPTGLQGSTAVALTDLLTSAATTLGKQNADALTTLAAQNAQQVSAILGRPLADPSTVVGGAAAPAADSVQVAGLSINKTLLWSVIGGTIAIVAARKLFK